MRNPYNRRGKLLQWRKWLMVMCLALPVTVVLVLPVALFALLSGGLIRISHVFTA